MTDKSNVKLTRKSTSLRIFAVAAVFFAALLVFAAPAAAAEPIEITSEGDLKKIGDDSNYPLDGNYILTKDITLTYEWTPIGKSNNPFTGTFDGGDCEISGLTITNSEAGLFHTTNEATIKNLTVRGSVDVSNIDDMAVAGGIAAYAHSTTFENCISDVTLTLKGGSGVCVGGIVGYSDSLTMSNCKSYGEIKVSETTDMIYSGGIVGAVIPSQDSTQTIKFTDCYSSGDLNIESNAEDIYVGGITGLSSAESEFTYCSYSGDTIITGASTSVAAGGILGYSDSIIQITDSYTTGNINAAGNGIVVGGIAAGIIDQMSYSKISGCYSTGDMSVSGTNNMVIAGGILGMGVSAIENCYSMGDITAKAVTSAEDAQICAGGIVGYYISIGAEITQCYVTGSVNAEGGDNTAAIAGGIAGSVVYYQSEEVTEDITVINNCYVLSEKISKTGSGNSNLVGSSAVNNIVGRIMDNSMSLISLTDKNYAWCNVTVTGKGDETTEDTNNYNGTINHAYNVTRLADSNNDVWVLDENYPLPILKNLPSDVQKLNDKISHLTITISFTNNGNEVAEQSLIDGQNAKKQEITKTGYTLSGWNLNDNKDNWNFENPICSLDGKTHTLKANWTANTYQVVFHANNGTEVTQSQKFTYDKEQALTANTFTNEGCKFLGWAESDDAAEAKYKDEDSVKNLANENGATVNLYAVWDELSGNTDANTGTGGSSGGSAAILISGGHGGSVGSATYSITFDANGGSGTMNQLSVENGKTAPLTKNTFTREGYTFAGWALSANGEVAYKDGEEIKPERSMTLYAFWVEEIGEPADIPEETGQTEQTGVPLWAFAAGGVVLILAILAAVFIVRRK